MQVEEYYKKHFDRLVTRCRHKCPNDAEDVVQQAFLLALLNEVESEYLERYISTACKRLSKSFARKAYTSTEKDQREMKRILDSYDMEEDLENKDFVKHLVDTTDPIHRSLIERFVVDGWSIKKIAEHHNLSKRQVRRIIQQFREV